MSFVLEANTAKGIKVKRRVVKRFFTLMSFSIYRKTNILSRFLPMASQPFTGIILNAFVRIGPLHTPKYQWDVC